MQLSILCYFFVKRKFNHMIKSFFDYVNQILKMIEED